MSIVYFYRLYFLLAVLVFVPCSYAQINNDQPPMIGNFALPFSQQPGAFLSFGQNTLDKGKTQLYLFADDYVGNRQHFIDVMPGIVFGVTDNLSIFLNVPIAISYQQESNHSAGLGDALIQFEYIFYSKQTNYYSATATMVLNTSFPTGSSTKNPPTGFGAQSYFLGGTYTRMYTDWLLFLSSGVLAPSSRHGTQFGNNYLYQLGLGKNISYIKSQYIFSWLVELNGTFYEKNKMNGIIDPNSGGNIIYVIPSLWFSTQHTILQVGIGWPVAQHWNGNQPNSTYLIAANIGWTF